MNKPRTVKENIDYSILHNTGERVIKVEITTSLDRLKLKEKNYVQDIKNFIEDNPLQEIEEVGDAGKTLDDFSEIVGFKECHTELALNLGGDYAGEYQYRTQHAETYRAVQ